ncbi:uncharacterized protein DNG_02260 [Cephalotrichum gorgonifer]|uniref:Uncharacterized protein n=1 Tax=Cephalotrichum gorgonifer TaxID=2041049 RepID=A0AAE8MUT8_9PEZI|nr:uncharacterized protein DNG_02260 [Cephalotrichum gorgonifer]
MLGRGIIGLLVQFEDHIIQAILRRPGFHRFVGRIQRSVDEARHGKSPLDPPLRQGEATETPGREGGFLSYFMKELKNQANGRPTKGDGRGGGQP